MENKKLSKGLVYYTDNKCNEKILNVVRKNLLNVSNGNTIISVSLAPLDFGQNIVLSLERGYLAMYKQILAGLEAIDTDVVFIVEHDVIYPKCHFDFVPSKKDVFYYNINWWLVRSSDGQAVTFKGLKVSGLCAFKELLIEHYRERVKRTEQRFSGRMGFEPGLHKFPRGVDDYEVETWRSDIPYIDIRHGGNLSPSRPRFECRHEGYTVADEVPFWGKTKGRFDDFLAEIDMLTY